jgi:hypothetical protein
MISAGHIVESPLWPLPPADTKAAPAGTLLCWRRSLWALRQLTRGKNNDWSIRPE